jgi:hypothetical protein
MGQEEEGSVSPEKHPKSVADKDHEMAGSVWSLKLFWLVWTVLLCISLASVKKSVEYACTQLVQGITPTLTR